MIVTRNNSTEDDDDDDDDDDYNDDDDVDDDVKLLLNICTTAVIIARTLMTITNRGHPCFGLAAIFGGMLYSVQIIHRSSTRDIKHMSIIVIARHCDEGSVIE